MPDVSGTGVVPVGSKMVSELRAIVRLDTFNGVGKGFGKVVHEQGGE